MKRTIFIWLSMLLAVQLKAQKMYPLSTADNMIICTGSENIVNTDKIIFANSLLWAIDKGSKLKENILQCDLNAMRYTARMSLASANDSKQSYTCNLTIQVISGQLVYLVSEIQSVTAGILGKSMPFEKLNPEKKVKHKACMDGFVLLNSRMLDDFFKFVRENQISDLSHWDSVCNGNLVKGMNMTECKLIMGRPVDVQESPQRVQWMYDAYTYLFFEKGLLTTILK